MKLTLVPALFAALFAQSSFADVLEVKVKAAGGKYYLNDELTPTLAAKVGDTLIFDLSDSSLRSHPFYLTERADSRKSLQDAVVNPGTITLDINEDTPKQIFYSCTRHSNMGGTGSVIVSD